MYIIYKSVNCNLELFSPKTWSINPIAILIHSCPSPCLTEWCKMIEYLQFYVLLKNISLIWRRHYYRWRAAKFRPMLGTQGLWAGRDLYRATPAETRGLGFSGLIRMTSPFCCLLRHTRGCGGSILTRIFTGPLLVAFYDTQGDVEDLFSPRSSRVWCKMCFSV
jgi:hypothetical protein